MEAKWYVDHNISVYDVYLKTNKQTNKQKPHFKYKDTNRLTERMEKDIACEH